MPKTPKPVARPPDVVTPLSTHTTAPNKAQSGHQTFKEAFPPEDSYRQIEYRSGESDKVFADTDNFYAVSLDRGSMLAVWELIEAEVARKWGNSLHSHKALARGVRSFRDAYRGGPAD
jgi:hypothetical protein